MARVTTAEDGIVVLQLSSADGLMLAQVALDFPAERLRFDAIAGLRVQDNGSSAAAARGADYYRFLKEWMSNG
jgi:hypothetical protein